MHKTKLSRAVALFCSFTLLTLLFALPVHGTANLSFVAVNDTVPMTLTSDALPFYSGGILYVPYTAFNAANIGFFPSYNVNDKNLTLFNRNSRLVFDLSTGTVTNEDKETLSAAAIVRGSMVFLPAEFCANYFYVNVSNLTSLGGYQIIRFTNGNQVYDDSLFIEKAENLIAYRVSQHLEAETPSTPDVPSTPSTPTTPTTPDTDAPEEEPEEEPIEISLAITGADAMESALETLVLRDVPAVFFLTAEEIAANGDLVRQIVSSGYKVGLTAGADENADEALRAANDALDIAVHQKSLLVLLPQVMTSEEISAHYVVFIKPDIVRTASSAALVRGTEQLFVCESSALSASLAILREANFSPLLETSRFAS